MGTCVSEKSAHRKYLLRSFLKPFAFKIKNPYLDVYLLYGILEIINSLEYTKFKP